MLVAAAHRFFFAGLALGLLSSMAPLCVAHAAGRHPLKAVKPDRAKNRRVELKKL